MIINIEPGTFGGPMRMGDLIACANVVESMNQGKKDDKIKFHLRSSTIINEDHCKMMYMWLLQNTEYFSDEPSNTSLPWKKVNLWDFRDISGDLVTIPNKLLQKKKIVVCPLFDAQYNTWRNWPKSIFEQIIQIYNNYDDYEKVIITKNNITVDGWTTSSNFIQNLNHIMEAETFIGGDTGTSHFAWSLDRSPQNLIYYGSSRGLIHTLPFYLLKGKGKMVNYWLDCEGTTWK